ncbi:MAG TPA: class I SAM-dependent methyltransferase [Chitinophagaceae bacterium]|nr:class I SAM-dependent methyltransferase [Chitinophagaceae bacterium]
MNIEESYNEWAAQYDAQENKTRDLEAFSLQQTVASLRFNRILEIGCGTGKNTALLHTISKQVVAVDLSAEMLAVAKTKQASDNITFLQADITKPWHFATGLFDLVTFSLVLEHINNLPPVFANLSHVLQPGGKVYISELHPFKQYSGSKARFETAHGTHVVPCFTHHVSDYTNAAKQAGLEMDLLTEYFDNNDRQTTPRLLTLLLGKP